MENGTATAPADPQSESAQEVARPRPLRADAARNRAKLVAAATEVFGEQGAEASLEEIARRAGVGVGTLYRNFPTRACLIEQVYRESVEDIVSRGAAMRGSREPFEALATWLDQFVAYVARKKGMAAAMRDAMGPESEDVFREQSGRMMGVAGELLGDAQRAGVVRPDVDAFDIMRSVSGMCLAAAAAHDPDSTKRVLRLVLDGMRYGAPADVRPAAG
ncbi:TetR/AcrR family transcriptional regulator [Luteimicrobium subarcticum]|uniref:TetR family transcriptional regulator n=1 Tax=Luteimicrobium subarcticum TaxID=620910 RepID=A0A2M8WJB4_9MICO|nr:TetR family transcriptional regulator [Luteimicrobium subarcticum]PJI91021.1 TetR family transcriptional regulator [Luteimicrobium subarcticum]